MTRRLEAIYEGGVLRPLQPLDLRENQRVSVIVSDSIDDEALDNDYIRFCEDNADYSITLEQVQQALAKIPGSMTADFVAEREDRF
jgi:predicted DNA-binding antitoxin AbrB/MazE fold protein